MSVQGLPLKLFPQQSFSDLSEEGLFSRIPIELIKNIMDHLPVQNKGVLEGFHTLEKFFPYDQVVQREWMNNINYPCTFQELRNLPPHLRPYVRALDLTDEIFVRQYFPVMTNLQCLRAPLTKEIVSGFSLFPCPEKLKVLIDSNIDPRLGLTDDKMSFLGVFKNLEKLTLQRQTKLNFACAHYDFSQLTHLFIKKCSNFFKGFNHIPGLVLNLQEFHAHADGLLDVDFAFLNSCTTLKILNLNVSSYSNVSGSFLTHLQTEVLEEFQLVNKFSFRDKELALLGAFKHLKKLVLGGKFSG